jgi:dethiobiotin synthetase
MNVNVGVMKPFASGYKATDNFVSDDVKILMKYSGVDDPIDLVNPYFFEIPTSPYDACKQLNLEIEIDKVIDSYKQLTSIHDVVIVEGIGGIMTPISKNYFVSDLISDLQMNTIIVTGSKVGAVNHLMLTYQHVKEKNLHLNGFVINQNVSDGYESSNLKQQIIDLTGQTVYGIIPYQKSFNIESYVKNFSNFVDISSFGFENI